MQAYPPGPDARLRACAEGQTIGDRTGHAEEQRRKYRAAWRRNLTEAAWWAATALSVWYLWNR